MFRRIADALTAHAEATCALTCELRQMREQRERGLVTLEDLTAAKNEILKAIQPATEAELVALNRLNVRTKRNTLRLEALDAKTPN